MALTSGQPPHWRLARLELRGIRGFRSLDLDFSSGTPQRPAPSVVIGTNGTGKTTLLRAIVLGLVDESDAQALLAFPNGGLLSTGAREGSITVHLRGRRGQRETRTKTIHRVRSGERIVDITSLPDIDSPSADTGAAPLFVAAYGIARTRRGESLTRAYRHFDSVETLFNYDAQLVPAELGLRRFKDFAGTKRFTSTINALKRALNLKSGTTFTLPKGGGVEVSGPQVGSRVPLEGLADGYRINLAWIFDLFGHAMTADAWDEKGRMSGILLVDELEQHAHPAVQRILLDRLRSVFPGMQIICTTHSPLVALGQANENVIALHRRRGQVRRVEVRSNMAGMTAEDLLEHGGLFGTSPFPPEMDSRLKRHKALTAVKDSGKPLSASKSKEVASLGRRLTEEALTATAPDLAQEIRDLRQKFAI